MAGFLTDKKINALIRAGKAGRFADRMNNLSLQIVEWTSKKEGAKMSASWVFRYARGGRTKYLGLGPYPVITLARAREKALELRRCLAEGIDPADFIAKQKFDRDRASAKRVTFREYGERYIAHQAPAWGATHAEDTRRALARHVFPKIGDMAVADINTPAVRAVLDPIWHSQPETAKRLRGRIENILDAARVDGLRTGENPARWRGHLNAIYPAPAKLATVTHHPALGVDEIPQFMAWLRGVDTMVARALEFTVLTAARSKETRFATWDEINLIARRWVVPAAKYKTERDHTVPLSSRACEILANLPRMPANPYVFYGEKPRQPLGARSMYNFIKAMDRAEAGIAPDTKISIHGFRSALVDWALDRTDVPEHVAKAALGHVAGDAVHQAYRRGDALEKRAHLLELWAAYCGSAGIREGDRARAVRAS